MTSSAIISRDRKYRYRLERDGFGEGWTAVIMVNPSTADATEDDATIRKLKGFGFHNRWGRIVVGNLFAYRATDVRDLANVIDPVGPSNDAHLASIISDADRIVFAWGPLRKQPVALRDRWKVVNNIVRELGKIPMSIGAPAQCGHPKHPLMLPYSSPIIPWSLDK